MRCLYTLMYTYIYIYVSYNLIETFIKTSHDASHVLVRCICRYTVFVILFGFIVFHQTLLLPWSFWWSAHTNISIIRFFCIRQYSFQIFVSLPRWSVGPRWLEMPSVSRKHHPPGKGLANGGRCPKCLGFSLKSWRMAANGVMIVFRCLIARKYPPEI